MEKSLEIEANLGCWFCKKKKKEQKQSMKKFWFSF